MNATQTRKVTFLKSKNQEKRELLSRKDNGLNSFQVSMLEKDIEQNLLTVKEIEKRAFESAQKKQVKEYKLAVNDLDKLEMELTLYNERMAKRQAKIDAIKTRRESLAKQARDDVNKNKITTK